MEAKPAQFKFGKSLIVPCVQEIAKEDLIAIPPRYVRPQDDNPIVLEPVIGKEIPIIDMQKLFSDQSSNSELANLHFASKDWGFFQLVNHGVSSSLIQKVKKDIQDFFNLPIEEKKRFWQDDGDVEGFGQAFVLSEEQKLDWGDLFFLTTQPPQERKPHLFPKLPLPFRETLEVYSKELKDLAMAIITKMGKALKMRDEEMNELFENGIQSMRMNYYPPCPQPEQVIGLTPHSDAVGLTILLQINEVDGLQVRDDNKWVPVKPLQDAFIVNIGDIMEIISNGIYKSIEHRATVNSDKERLSIATFYSTAADGEIAPAPSLITRETPQLFSRIKTTDYYQGYLSREHDGKSYIDLFRIPA